MENISKLKEVFNDDGDKQITLSIIIRKMQNKKKVYEIFKIDWSSDLRAYMLSAIESVLDNIEFGQNGMVVKDYEVVSDSLDEEKIIYRYDNNDNIKFTDVVKNQLPNRESKAYVTSLDDIKNRACGYAVSYFNEDEKLNAYFISKLTKSKIYTDKPSGLKGKIKCLLNTTDSKLERLSCNLIEFDNQIDCVFTNDKYYIFNKKKFENLVDIESEFRLVAGKIIEQLSSFDIIKGIELVKKVVEKDKRHLRRIQNIAKRSDYANLDENRLRGMQAVAKEFGLKITIKDSEITISDEGEVEEFLKLLDKYFLECMQTGEKFGANAKVSLKQE